MDNKQKKVVSAIVKDFQKKNKRNPKDDKELAQFVQSQGGDKYIKRKTQEVLGGQTQEQEQTTEQKQTPEQKQKAAHGAKLNYFKSLKHKCADDEELYYYKKGGSVGCGCKKKEDGGEITKAWKGSAVDKFKAMKMQKAGKVRTKAEQDRINKQSEEDAINGTYGMSQKQIKKFNNPKVTKETYTEMDGKPGQNKIQRIITHREPTMKNDTTYNRTLHSQYGDNRLKFSSSNSGDRRQYKKDEESFNRAKMWSKEKGGEIKKNCGGASVVKAFKAARCGSKLKK